LIRHLELFALAAAVAGAGALAAGQPAFAYAGERYAKEARISLQDARGIALKRRPGKITDEELERERGGTGLRYSFDIRAADATYEVGVDARTGKVLEDKREGPHPD
jgi:uncharacterized membrane protein YkoI